MLVVADTHIHFYACFDMSVALSVLMDRLESHAGGAEHVKVACLCEREDCDWFREAGAGAATPPEGFVFERIPGDDSALVVIDGAGRRLYVIAGRQYSTSERIEVVALGTDERIEGEHTAREFVSAIGAASALPVLSWSFGKWLGRRSAVVKDVVAAAEPGGLVIGDISIRPRGVPEPSAFADARAKGITFMAGTDPLPRSGEECAAGNYCTIIDGDFDEDNPSSSMKNLLRNGENVRIVGRRNSLFTACLRMALYTFGSSSSGG